MRAYLKRHSKKLLIPLLLLTLSCSNNSGSGGYELIAHAGGAIDGYTLTNSREALEAANRNGYRYIELDLALTADSVLVATHNWALFNNMSGHAQMGDSAPTIADFITRKIYGRYTPLTAEDINNYFRANEHLFLVTDKISDSRILERYFPALKKRMMVEAFSHSDYVRLKQEGYHRVLYSCLARDIDKAIIKHLLLGGVFGDKIDWIALHTSSIDYPIFKIADALCNYRAAIYTINNRAQIPEELLKRASYIYTDSILP